MFGAATQVVHAQLSVVQEIVLFRAVVGCGAVLGGAFDRVNDIVKELPFALAHLFCRLGGVVSDTGSVNFESATKSRRASVLELGDVVVGAGLVLHVVVLEQTVVAAAHEPEHVAVDGGLAGFRGVFGRVALICVVACEG